MERVKGIEPSRPAWKAGALPLSYTRIKVSLKRSIKKKTNYESPSIPTVGRDSRIRTCDPLVPSEVRYQTALYPVDNTVIISIQAS